MSSASIVAVIIILLIIFIVVMLNKTRNNTARFTHQDAEKFSSVSDIMDSVIDSDISGDD